MTWDEVIQNIPDKNKEAVLFGLEGAYSDGSTTFVIKSPFVFLTKEAAESVKSLWGIAPFLAKVKVVPIKIVKPQIAIELEN